MTQQRPANHRGDEQQSAPGRARHRSSAGPMVATPPPAATDEFATPSALSPLAPGALLLLTVKQAASCLAVSRAHIYRLLQAGELHAVKSRAATRVPYAELQRYVARLIEEQP